MSRVLMTGMPVSAAAPYQKQLESIGFEVLMCEDPARAAAAIEEQRIEAVVSAYPLAPGELGSLVSALHQRGGRNASACMLLIAPPSNLRAASSMVGRGIHKALSSEEDPAVLRIVVERMVNLEQPMIERLQIQLPVHIHGGGADAKWITENLSGGGMLVCASPPLAVSSTLSFALDLPGGSIEGEGVVVRHVRTACESVEGFGVRFLSFEDDGRQRLLEYLQEIRLQSDTSADAPQ